MENEKLRELIKALGQRNQLEALGTPSLGESAGADIVGRPEPTLPVDMPKFGEPERGPASDRKVELMQELARLKAARELGVGEVEEADDLGLEQEEAQGLPNQDMKLKALQDVLSKMGK